MTSTFDSRFVSLPLGIASLAAGVAAALLTWPWLAVAAGVLGLFTAVAIIWSDRPEPSNPREVDKLQKEISELEEAVAAQVHARMSAEESATSLGKQLAEAEQRGAEVRDLASVDADAPTEELADESTGLFGERYFKVTVDARVASARRHLRPLAVALVDVVENAGAQHPNRAEAQMVAETIQRTLRESDTACRLGDGHFAVVLEDTPESGAIWTIERIRRELSKSNPELTLWAGIACYPAHAFDAMEVLDRAQQALASAKDWHQDRIEIANADG